MKRGAVKAEGGSPRKGGKTRGVNPDQDEIRPASLLAGHPTSHSLFAESYRTLRTNIHFSLLDTEFRSLLVTSAGEQEGKSTTVANLSHTMAQAGKSVLMVDADLRKPSLSSLFAFQRAQGLSTILSETFDRDIGQGSLADTSVGDLFRLVSFQKKTGVLRVETRDHKIDIYFHHGELADVHWPTRPREKRMAALLVKNKLLSKEQVEQALLRTRDTGQKLGFILLNMGLVGEDDLTGFIRLHMLEALGRAVLSKEGTYSFERLPASYFEGSSFDPVDLPELYRKVVTGEENLIYLERDIKEKIVPTETENLFLLPSGPSPPQPSELLGSVRMRFLLRYLKRRFDVIVLDTPPVLPASDALVLAPQVEGVVLVVKAGGLNRDLVRKAVDQVTHTRANLLGVILNQVKVDKQGGYYRYYHKYY